MTFPVKIALLTAALAAGGSLFGQNVLPGNSLGSAPLRHAPAVEIRSARTVTPPGGFTVNMQSRESVRAFYTAVFAAADGREPGWNGSAETGVAGTTDAAFREAVRLRINCFRAMAGVPSAIVFSDTFNAKCQQAALMMSVNNDLQHTPPTTWTFYTAAGAEAAENSNLSLGDYGADAVSGYMEDPGASNADVGHRRWLLYPQTQTMGTGDVPSTPTLTGPRRGANAVWVIDSKFGTTRPAVRDNFVAWPPPGYVPHKLVYPRWSLSLPAADFSSATVSLTKNGTNVPVTKEPVTSGFGENTLVWFPQSIDPNNWQPGPGPAADEVYVATVSGVKLSNVVQSPITYTVRAFDAAKPGPDTVEPVITGPATVTVAQPADFTCATVPGATDYDWELVRLGAPPVLLGAEGGTAGIIPHVSGYSVLANTGASGSRSYHLTTIDPSPQWFELSDTYLPQTDATLRFKSRFGYAGTGQTARLQISRDEGLTWADVFTRTGDNGAGDASFENRTINLASYAGRSIRVRFRFDYLPGGVGFFESADDVGWLVDDITFTNTETVGEKTTARDDSTFTATPAATGAHVVRVRPVYFDAFPGEWAPVSPLSVVAPSGTLNVALNPPEGGTVTAGFAGTTQRPIGSAFRIQAIPAAGYFFTGWTGGLTSAAPTLDFIMPENLSLTAGFIRDEIAAGAGSYAGLLADAPASHATAGALSLTATGKGTFTGRIVLAGKTTRFSGKITPTGEARFGVGSTAPLALPKPLAFTIALTGPNAGTLSGTLDGVPFTVTRRNLGTVENPLPATWLGAYTARLSPAAPASGAWPEGDGWARIAIASTGSVKLTGVLADGTKLATSGWVENNGRIPFYIRLHGGNGSLSGRMTIANLPASDINAPLRWFRPASGNPRFPDGWPTGLDCALSGAHFAPPVAPERIFADLDSTAGAATLRAESLALSPALTWPLVVAPSTSKVSLAATATDRSARVSFSTKTGIFTASFRNPATGRAYRGKGVVIQKEQLAAGFALSPTGSVRIRISATGP